MWAEFHHQISFFVSSIWVSFSIFGMGRAWVWVEWSSFERPRWIGSSLLAIFKIYEKNFFGGENVFFWKIFAKMFWDSQTPSGILWGAWKWQSLERGNLHISSLHYFQPPEHIWATEEATSKNNIHLFRIENFFLKIILDLGST